MYQPWQNDPSMDAVIKLIEEREKREIQTQRSIISSLNSESSNWGIMSLREMEEAPTFSSYQDSSTSCGRGEAESSIKRAPGASAQAPPGWRTGRDLAPAARFGLEIPSTLTQKLTINRCPRKSLRNCWNGSSEDSCASRSKRRHDPSEKWKSKSKRSSSSSGSEGRKRRRSRSIPKSRLDRSGSKDKRYRSRFREKRRDRKTERKRNRGVEIKRSRSKETNRDSRSSPSGERTTAPKQTAPVASIDGTTSEILSKFISIIKDVEGKPTAHKEETPTSPKILHKDLLPEFDPDDKSNAIVTWITRVDDITFIAKLFGWEEKEILQYALSKLAGNAKVWYSGHKDGAHSWSEWKKKLVEQFPCPDFCHMLKVLQQRECRNNETFENYFHDKLILVKRCGIRGRQAVDCVLQGIADESVRLFAAAAQFDEPEELLRYLRTVQSIRKKVVASTVVTPTVVASTVVETTVVEPTVVVPTVVETTVVEPTVVEPTVVEPTVVEPTVVEPTVVEPTVVEPTVVEPTVVEPTVVEPTVVKPTVVELTIVTPTAAKPTTTLRTIPPNKATSRGRGEAEGSRRCPWSPPHARRDEEPLGWRTGRELAPVARFGLEIASRLTTVKVSRRSRTSSPEDARRSSRSKQRHYTPEKRKSNNERKRRSRSGSESRKRRLGRSGSRDEKRYRSRSRERKCEGSMERKRDRSTERKRDRSVEKKRSRSKERNRDNKSPPSRDRQDSSTMTQPKQIIPEVAVNDANSDILSKVISIIKDVERKATGKKIELPPKKFPYKDVLPEFDPDDKANAIVTWITRVDDIAKLFNWEEKEILQYAMPKLAGLAKVWYLGRKDFIYSWPEWKKKLVEQFPCPDFCQMMEELKQRKCGSNETYENYFHDKLVLIKRCGIRGRQALDYVVQGIAEETVRRFAAAAHYDEPEELLRYLQTAQSIRKKVVAPMVVAPMVVAPRFSAQRIVAPTAITPATAKPTPTLATIAPHKDKLCNYCKKLGHLEVTCQARIVAIRREARTKCTICLKFGHGPLTCQFNKTEPNLLKSDNNQTSSNSKDPKNTT